jgi:cyclopropane-fatty-acyl-phospholipid synthase
VGTSSKNKPLPSGASLYQRHSDEEEQCRTNFHYERPPQFFQLITGGEWNVYSCNLWETALTETESQTEKLDMFAKLVNLQPKQRILDVGCGWGGPLVYLCKKFDLRGVGLTASLSQKQTAEQRAAALGVDAKIIRGHWKDLENEGPFDFIYSDEVLVHVYDLAGFFQKMNLLLHDDGMMLHKELHLSHPDWFVFYKLDFR